MLASPKHLIFSAALLLAGVPAYGAEESSAVAPKVVPTAAIKCPGVSSIPFTADAEQALPLRIVGTLACGDTVAILSDGEGYTARIRTREGQEGYVPRMYLVADGDSTAPAEISKPSSAEAVNGVARWESGAPGCVEFLSHGRHVESITANGITVQVSLQDSGWKYRANVAISNQSGASVEVQTGIVSLDELQPNLRPLLATKTSKVAHTPSHQVLWTLADAVPSPSAIALHSNGAKGAPTVERPSYRISPEPDYLSPQLILASTRPGVFARTQNVDVEAIALKSASLPAGQTTAGVLWFDRDGNARELSLRVPVGDTIFDFAFSLDEKK
jgi:hypothetical protein